MSDTITVDKAHYDALHAAAVMGLGVRILEIIASGFASQEMLLRIWGAATQTTENAWSRLPRPMLDALVRDARVIGYWFVWDGKNGKLVPIPLKDAETGRDWETLFARYLKEQERQ